MYTKYIIGTYGRTNSWVCNNNHHFNTSNLAILQMLINLPPPAFSLRQHLSFVYQPLTL